MSTLETEVLIIGGGVTGAGIMRDLALRGIHCILVDKSDLCAGASGGNHGLLHSGARYVSNDLQSAVECRKEGHILREIAPHCIEETGGLFVGMADDDAEFAEKFPQLCRTAGIACGEISSHDARELEPELSDRLVRAYLVPDAAIDPFHLALENVAHAAMINGSSYLPHCGVVGFAQQDGLISLAHCRDSRTGEHVSIRARQFVNAGGGWAMHIAALAGCSDVRILWSKGTLLVTHTRLTDRVINRLRPPSDGDILVPGGTVSILGTTSLRTDTIDDVRPTVEEVDHNIREGRAMIPALEHTRFIRAFARVRPLVQNALQDDDRSIARSYSLFTHSSVLENFCTISGGKLTTYRLMAEKTADLVAGRLGNERRCTTHATPLPDSGGCRWTVPGESSRTWFTAGDAEDLLLCECEMVPQSAISQILAEAPGAGKDMNLTDIALRSRAGKGSCQGSFCGMRLASFLYDCRHYCDSAGLHDMRDFFSERFKGMRPVLWGEQMAQMELAQALHNGLLGLDLLDAEFPTGT